MLTRTKTKQSGQSIWYFYWTRPIGASQHHFRLSLTTKPLWGCKHLGVDSLSSEIASSRPCTKLEVIITRDTRTLLPLSVAENEWDIICMTLGTYHGSSLTSLRFVGLTQEQMMRMMDSLKERNSGKIQSIEIVLSKDFPGVMLQYLGRYFSFLKELHLLDPGKSVLVPRPTELREFIESSSDLRLLLVEPRSVLTSSEGRIPNRGLDLLLYTTQQSVALEHVIFSFACVGQSQTKPNIKPKTLEELLKEPKRITRRNIATSLAAPKTVICPEFLSVSKDKLQFALSCNAFRRQFIEDSTATSNGTDEMLAIVEASLRVLKDWMIQED